MRIFSTCLAAIAALSASLNVAATPGVFYVKDLDHGVRVHTYSVGPALNDMHIIETPKSLIVIDALGLPGESAEALRYARTLRKPIARVYISHAHDHHVTGLATFADRPLYALPETIDAIKKEGPGWMAALKKSVGVQAPASVPVPAHAVKAGDERIDGVLFRFAKKQVDMPILEIRLPEQGVAVFHHFFYNGMHSLIAADTAAMVTQLEALKKESLNWIAAGHGVPGGPEIIDTQIRYQQKARSILGGAVSVEAAKQAIMEAYPTYGVPFLLDLSLPPAMDGKPVHNH